MSSKYVRDQIQAFMDAGLTDTTLDISGQFDEIKSFLAKNGVGPRDPWYGLQYIPSEDIPITVGSNNSQGKYRELGAVFIHIVSVAKSDSAHDIVDRGELVRDLFRGQRIGSIIIEGVTPVNFEAAATLQFEGGYTSASIVLNYYRDLDF